MDTVKKAFRKAPVLFGLTAFLVSVSLLLVLAAIPLGIAFGDAEKDGYFEKPNWSLHFLFFLILAVLIHLTWRSYLEAWQSLPEQKVLYNFDDVEESPSALRPLFEALSKARPYLFALAASIGLLFTAADAGCLWNEYEIISGAEFCSEEDFTIAFRLNTFSFIDEDQKTSNGVFVLAAYVMQGALIAYAFMAFFQLAIQGFYFMRFEHRSFASRKRPKTRLSLRLRYDDPLKEFGLSVLNRAINMTYVFMALGMVLPVLSAASQPSDAPFDFGQWMLRLFLPLILLVPFVIPVADRISRVKEVEKRVQESGDPKAEEALDKQRLWPFEATRIAYVGKMAAAVVVLEYGYLIKRNLADLLPRTR